MARHYAIWQSFNGGEFSPAIDGRVDQEKYFTGAKTLENFIPTVPGPAVRRGGTRFVAEVKDQSKRTWLSTFQFNEEQSYIVEWGENYLRLFVNRAPLMSGGAPLEVATPYAEADLIAPQGTFALQTVQSADVLFVVSVKGDQQPRQLRRAGAIDWTFPVYDNLEGPFHDLRSDEAITLVASAATGAITLTASAALFTDADIGKLVYLEPENLAAVGSWQPGLGVGGGDIDVVPRRNAGNIYLCRGPITGATGAAPPIHDRGIGNDGVIDWEYLHSNYGLAAITAIASATVAQATVVKRLPDESATYPQAGVVANPTKWWAFEAWSDADGWPTTAALYKERLFFGKGRTIYASQVGDFFSHNRKIGPDFTPDAALVLAMATESVDEIRWMMPIANALAVGTAGSEVIVAGATENQPFSSTNATAVVMTSVGSQRLQAIRIGNVALFVQRHGRKIHEYRFALEEDRYVAPDLTILADHILANGVIDCCYQQEPDSILWVATGAGELHALTHNRDRGVVGWHRHPLGGDGFVESCASIPHPDGTHDDLWLIVRRTVNGTTRRYIEILERPLARGASKDDAFYVDCGVSYSVAGAPQTVFSGLDHLNGETVHILADGAVLPPQTVLGGQVTLSEPAARKVHIGLPYASRLQTMRVEAGASDGTAQGRIKRIAKVVLRLDTTLGGRVGTRFDRLSEILYRSSAMEMDEAPDLFTGDIRMSLDGDWSREGHICIVADQPLPMTVTAIVPQVSTNDA
jgi:hypothetical protein